ncbi:hypothetical protein B2G88_18345 [Natronolimnobius baerhuensis]|uniref:Uncharacterized protein n=1 Tax=Natronolimnobius baerhuensis TaxID=253108 RepID=A0A202E3Y1_9EURY|nr:hypothetical protein [Natronolimnobius baerhuensis]OVE82952.1 hypothetical protein B2G88_18345 [Natronolimnobius baerhuensis]
MSLATDPRPPLPEWVLEAYDVLTDAITRQGHDKSNCQVPSLHREDAISVLLSTNELNLEQSDVEYAVRRLIERGYLYEVDMELRITTISEDEI